MRRVERLPILARGYDTGDSVEIAAVVCRQLKPLKAHLLWLGFRLVNGPRGLPAVERLH